MVPKEGAANGLDPTRMAVAGDSVGGNMMAALALMANERGDAGVPVTTVRYDGITHDFMMLNPLSGTHATRAAVAQAISILRNAFAGA